MEINIEGKYKPEAGDILSWKDGNDHILFAVVENKPSAIVGMAIRDNRKDLSSYAHIPHVVLFPYHADTNHKLALELKARNVNNELANLINRWDA